MDKFKPDVSPEELKKIIKELPEEYAQVMGLYYLENNKPAEIAEQLQLSIGIIRHRLSKGIFLLRKKTGCPELQKAYKIIYGDRNSRLTTDN